MKLSEDLAWRGLIKDKTFDKETWLDKPAKFYLGIDASSDSLTIGNLAVMMLARRLIEGGWKAVLLAGGATSLVGDPGGKDEERELKSQEEIAANIKNVQSQIEKIFAGQKHELVNNLDWLGGVKYLDFLREVGKNYSITELIQREFVDARIGEGGAGISYAEFSYSLLQGYDFWHLFKKEDVTLQIGASDQWGNMLSGVPLIRKKEGKEAHAFSMPLVINKTTGKKFGKSEEGAVWLDAAKTSPTQFYQFWVNVDDAHVGDFLKIYTMISKSEFDKLMAEHVSHPEQRQAQMRLAAEVTELVHGKEETHTAEVVTGVLTGKKPISGVSEGILKAIRKEIPSVEINSNVFLQDIIVAVKLATSKTEAYRLIGSGAIYINGDRVSLDATSRAKWFDKGANLLRRGKAYKDSALVELK